MLLKDEVELLRRVPLFANIAPAQAEAPGLHLRPGQL